MYFLQQFIKYTNWLHKNYCRRSVDISRIKYFPAFN